MTAVLLLGDISSTGAMNDVTTESVALARDGTADQESAFLEIVRARLGAAGSVLAVYPAWSWRRGIAERLIKLVRGALATDRVAGIPLGLPPLALSLVADQLSHLARYVAPGTLASVAPRLPADIVAGAWVRGVTGLQEIKVPLAAQVASLTPGAFMVTAAPAPGVHRISGRRPVADLGRMAPRAALFAEERGGDSRWLRGRLAPALGTDRVVGVPPQPAGPGFWGTKRYVEFVAPSGDPRSMSHVVRTTPRRLCPWCGEPAPPGPCPFCAMSASIQEGSR